MACSAISLACGNAVPSLYRIGARSGVPANTDDASAPGQSLSSAITTIGGRVAGVRPGYAASATAAASTTGVDPPRRAVLIVFTPTAACAPSAGTVAVSRSVAFGESALPHPARAVQEGYTMAAARRGTKRISATLPAFPDGSGVGPDFCG